MAETQTPPAQPDPQAEAAEQQRLQAEAAAAVERQRLEEAKRRTSYAQMVDAIRAGATSDELEQACTVLRPIFQAVNARL